MMVITTVLQRKYMVGILSPLMLYAMSASGNTWTHPRLIVLG